MFTRAWFLDAAERVVRTALQTFVAVIGADLISTGLTLDLAEKAGIAALAAAAAALNAILGSKVGDPDTASVLK